MKGIGFKSINFKRNACEKALSRLFYVCGIIIARHKILCVLGSLIYVITLSCFAANHISYLDDPEYLFAPRHSRSHKERQTVAKLFPTNTSENFDVGRATRHDSFTRIIIEAKNQSILTVETWNDIIQIDGLVRKLEVPIDGVMRSYSSLCAKNNGRCFMNKFLKPLGRNMNDLGSGQKHLAYPLDILDDLYLPTGVVLGGVSLSDDGKKVLAAKAITLYYYLAADSRETIKRSQQWERAFVELMSTIRLATVNTYFFTSRTLAAELERNTLSVAPLLSITLVLMIAFTMGSCCFVDSWHEAKPWVGLMSCVTVLLSVIAATGTLVIAGIPFIGINLATPFLMLGIGLDDTFVMLSAWHHTSKTLSVEKRMADMLSDAGVSITITSLTNIISFIIGAYSPFPSVYIFCVYTAICAVYTFIFQIFFLGSFIVYWGQFEAERLHGLFGYHMKIDEVTLPVQTQPLNQTPSSHFFRDIYARMFKSKNVKTAILILFLVYIAGAFYGCSQMKEGLNRAKLTLDDSYAREFFIADDKYFKSFPYRIQIVFNRPLNYTQAEVADLRTIIHEFEASPFVNNRELTECWFRDGVNSTRIRSSFRGLVSRLRLGKVTEYLDSSEMSTMRKDVKWGSRSIISSRCMIQARNVHTSNDEKTMMVTLRAIADRYPGFNITVFNPMFLFFDQFLLVRSTTMQSITVATIVMILVALILIPSGWAVFWVAVSIVSIEVGVVGYMSLWSVNLDSISMINLIMCIGFSVDYSAHIAYAFLTGSSKTPEGRIAETLDMLGMPIVQGALSTLLGIAILAFTPSYIFMTFFKTICLVIVFGALHALVFLPVFLSLTFIPPA